MALRVIMNILFYIIIFLLSVPYLVLIERHYLGLRQLRQGPLKNRYIGLLQSFFDALKLFHKDILVPIYRLKFYYTFSPVFLFLLFIIELILLPNFYIPIFINMG
jgi:NADH:ubiquinone oxidoreductase subunit H